MSRFPFVVLGIAALVVALLLTGLGLQLASGGVILRPDGDSTPLAWTAVGCTSHFDCVDEIDSDGDTSYLVGPAGSPPRSETFTLTSEAVESGSEIVTISMFAIARMEVAGEQAAIRMSVLDASGTELCGTAGSLNTIAYQTLELTCHNVNVHPASIPDLRFRLATGGTEGDSQFRVTTAWIRPNTDVPPTAQEGDESGARANLLRISPLFFGLSLSFFSLAASEGASGLARGIVALALFALGFVAWTVILTRI